MCIAKEFKPRERLYRWFRLDFEAFLARMCQLENRQVLFIFSMCFDLELHERCGFPRINLVKLFELGAQEIEGDIYFLYKYVSTLAFFVFKQMYLV